MLDRWGQAYIRMLVATVGRASRHAVVVVATALLLTAASGWYIAGHFGIDTDTSALLSRDLAFQKNQHAIDAAFPQIRDTIVVVIDGQTPGLASAAARRLTAWLRQRPAAVQYVYQPGGGRFFATHGLLYLDGDQLQALSDRLIKAQPLLARLAGNPSVPGFFNLLARALEHQGAHRPNVELAPPLTQLSGVLEAFNHGRFRVLDWHRLMTPAHSARLKSQQRFVIVKPRFDYSRLTTAADSIARVRQGIAHLHLNPEHGVRARLTGEAVLNNQQLGSVADSAGWATALAFGLVIILLVVALRSPRMVTAALMTLIMGLVWSTAAGLAAVGRFNLLSITFAVMFVGMSVDFGIQFCMHAREVAAPGLRADSIVKRAAYGVGGALTLAGLTSAASFLSVVPTRYAGLADMGIVAGMSLLIAVIANLTVLPALLALLAARGDRGRLVTRSVSGYLPLQRFNKLIIGIATVIGIAALPQALSTQFNFNPLTLQDPRSEAVKTLKQLVRSAKFSPYRINVLTPNLTAADALVKRLAKRATVARALSLDSFIPDHQQQKLATIGNLALVMAPASLAAKPPPGIDVAAASHAIDRLLAALRAAAPSPPKQRLATALEQFEKRFGGQAKPLKKLQKRIFATFRYQLKTLRASLRAKPIDRDSLPARLRARYVTPNGRARVEAFSKLDLSDNRNLHRFVDDVRQAAPNAAGTPVLLVAGGRAVTHAFAQASVTAFIAIALLLWLVLGRLRDVVLALSTLPLAGLLTAASMRTLGLSFNLANIIVLPLLIGLDVAYGIYFVTRWQTGANLDRVLASSTPAAVLFSALTTMTSFGSLALSDSNGIAILGQTLTLALGYVLIVTLVVLPALLSLFPAPRE